MHKYSYLLIILVLISGLQAGSDGGYPGTYLNMGINATSLSMGRAGVAIPQKGAPMYNNPAGLAMMERRTAEFDYFFLNLDRNMHYTGLTTPVQPTAGLGMAWIHAGVDDIQGRNNVGQRTKNYQTGENAFILSLANAFTPDFAVGVSIKMLRNEMLDVLAEGVGIDIGMLLRLSDHLTLGAQVRDINSGYTWQTSEVFGDNEGQTYKESFPLKGLIGVAWQYQNLLVTTDLEYSNKDIFRYHSGIEYKYKNVAALRAGLNNSQPTFGGGLKYDLFNKIDTEMNYSLIFDSVGQGNTHLFSWKFLF
ncbi:MAG TPA: hypothetical protein VKP78_04620 [bacterium]|nr:hypothetical protein [bacterium]